MRVEVFPSADFLDHRWLAAVVDDDGKRHTSHIVANEPYTTVETFKTRDGRHIARSPASEGYDGWECELYVTGTIITVGARFPLGTLTAQGLPA